MSCTCVHTRVTSQQRLGALWPSTPSVRERSALRGASVLLSACTLPGCLGGPGSVEEQQAHGWG